MCTTTSGCAAPGMQPRALWDASAPPAQLQPWPGSPDDEMEFGREEAADKDPRDVYLNCVTVRNRVSLQGRQFQKRGYQSPRAQLRDI